jgi:hypothetical protein
MTITLRAIVLTLEFTSRPKPSSSNGSGQSARVAETRNRPGLFNVRPPAKCPAANANLRLVGSK